MYACAARLFVVLTLAGTGIGFGDPAFALERPNLGTIIFGAPKAAATPVVGRYQATEGGGSFVLEAVPGKQALLKFEDNPEIWALHATPGPRGDVIYKNDMDEPVVRTTSLGGITVFTQDQPEGMPAAWMGQASAPRMPRDMEPETLFNIFVQASARASRITQHLVIFESAQDVTPFAAPVFADAAILTSQAFSKVNSKGKFGHDLVARFVKVEFNAGRNAAAATKGQVVWITVCPDQGVAGRPSSQRIASVISRK